MLSVLVVCCCITGDPGAPVLGAEGPATELEKWIGDAVSPRRTVRAQAADQLAKLGAQAKPAVPSLIESLGIAGATEMVFHNEASLAALEAIDPNWRQSQPAADAFVNYVQRLRSGDESQRFGAALVLGIMGDERSVVPLIAALDDDARRVRLAAVEALQRYNDPRALEPLLRCLTSQEHLLRGYAVQALRGFGDQVLAPLVGLLEAGKLSDWAIANEVGSLFVGFGSAAVTSLLPLLESDLPMVRWGAVRVLGKIGDPRTVDSLILLISDPDERVRNGVGAALGEMKAAAGVETLVLALNDQSPMVRWNAAWALGEIRDNRAVMPLVERLRDADANVRDYAATSLGKLRDPRAVAALIGILDDSSAAVRASGVRALGDLGDRRAEPALATLAKDESSLVRQEVAEARGKLARGR